MPLFDLARNKECITDEFSFARLVPLILPPDTAESKASIIGSVFICIVQMAVGMRKESGIPPWAKATGLPAALSMNMSQSSNDTFPTAMHIVTVLELANHLIPHVKALRDALWNKAVAWVDVVKIGRTHLQPTFRRRVDEKREIGKDKEKARRGKGMQADEEYQNERADSR